MRMTLNSAYGLKVSNSDSASAETSTATSPSPKHFGSKYVTPCLASGKELAGAQNSDGSRTERQHRGHVVV